MTSLAIAARNMLRVGHVARDVDGVQHALDIFDQHVPNAVKVRDILEHYDKHFVPKGVRGLRY